LIFKKECNWAPAVPNINRKQIIKQKAPEERHVIVSNSYPGFNPDFALEVRDERGTPTARLCGAGVQKIRDLYSKFVAALRMQRISLRNF
jgi:hypothetical protein